MPHCNRVVILNGLDVFFIAVYIIALNWIFLFSLSSSRERAAAAGANAASGPHREAWSNKGSAYADLYTQNVVISMEEQDEQHKQSNESKAPKEQPVWLTQSTVQGAYSEPDNINNRKLLPYIFFPVNFIKLFQWPTFFIPKKKKYIIHLVCVV